jgi:type I restriction enzyme M protein
MSKKVALALFDALRLSPVAQREVALPLLQLLAWDKLNREHPELELPDITKAADRVDCRLEIRHGLEILQRHPSLYENSDAFMTDAGGALKFVRELSEGDLRQVLAIIREARNQPCNYPEMVDTVLSAISMRDLSYHFVPDEVADLMVLLARVSADTSVYCPFATSLKLAERSNRISRSVFIETQEQSPLPFLLNLLMGGSLAIRIGHPIYKPGWVERGELTGFDVSVASPPIGARYGTTRLPDIYRRFPEQTLYGDVVHLRHILAQTKKRAVVLVANGMLFRTSAGERDFKEYLVRARLLEAVIGLPDSMVAGTSIPCSILLLNQDASSDFVFFVDAKAEHFSKPRRGRRVLRNAEELFRIIANRKDTAFSRGVSQKELETNEYNLTPSRYVASEKQARLNALLGKSKVVSLGEIAAILRPQSLKNDIVEEGLECFEVAVADIGADGVIRQPKKNFFLNSGALRKLQSLVLRAGDILLAVKGSAGKVGFIESAPDGTWLANQSFQVIRLKDDDIISPAILFRYLSSPAGQALLEARVGGASVPMIQTHDIRTLPVIIPSRQEQSAILEDYKTLIVIHEKIAQLRQEAEKLSTKHWAI